MFKIGEEVFCECLSDLWFKDKIVKIIDVREKDNMYLVEAPTKERKWIGGSWLGCACKNSAFKVGDIATTFIDGAARVVKIKEIRGGIKALVWFEEQAIVNLDNLTKKSPNINYGTEVENV